MLCAFALLCALPRVLQAAPAPATNNFPAPYTHSIPDNTNTPVFTNVTIGDGTSFTLSLSGTNQGTFISTTNNPGATNQLIYTGTNYFYNGESSSTNVTILLRGLLFVPTPNHVPVGSNETTTFTLAVGNDTATNYSVTAISVNDETVVTGVSTNPASVTTGNILSPFVNLTLSDPDQNLNPANRNGEDLICRVTLSESAPMGWLELNGNYLGTNYFQTNDPVASTLSLRALIYNVPSQSLFVTNSATITLTVTDGHGNVITNTIPIAVFSRAPAFSGVQSGQIVNDKSTLAPFSQIGIQSYSGNAVTVQITLGGGATNDAQGTLVNLGPFVKTTSAGAPSVYSYSAVSATVAAAMRIINFTPAPNRIPGGTNDITTFKLKLIDGPFTNINTATTVSVSPVNDQPTLGGFSSLYSMNDNDPPYGPFPAVGIQDVDEGGQQRVVVTVSLDNAANGVFSAASLADSGFVQNGNVYKITNTPPNCQSAIRLLQFVPTRGLLPEGLSTNITFTIRADDTYGSPVVNSATVVKVTATGGNGPFINLPAQPVSLRVAPNIYPFAEVTVADANPLKLGLRLNNPAQGAFTSDSLAASGFTNQGGGNYYITGTATNINAALALLDFAPATNLVTGVVINFTLNLTNTVPNSLNSLHSIVLRTAPNSFIVTQLTDYDPADSGVPDSQKYGTLRRAVALAGDSDHITFDIRAADVSQPDYPAVIRLVAPLDLDKNLTFDGPGAERLSLSGDSDGNGTADIPLFTVSAAVTMNRLTFTKGYSPNAGGAFEVSAWGDLKLSYCAVTDSQAEEWGGGIDVYYGHLALDHCLIAGNKTGTGQGQGGGGVSLFTDQSCTLVNTTFDGNQQSSAGGLGGGALYAETSDPGTEFDVDVLSCTFHGNGDAAGSGSSILPNGFNTVARLQNTIVADGKGKNLDGDHGGSILTLGGNISDDTTSTTFAIGGGTSTTLFKTNSPLWDKISVTNIVGTLSNNGGPTFTCALTSNTNAIHTGISNTPTAAFYITQGTDQRGYFRESQLDRGAFERGAGKRLIIQELRCNTEPTNQFIEFCVPRDSTNLNVAGFRVKVDGVVRHTFAAQAMQPGQAIVLLSAGSRLSNTLPSSVYSQTATNPLSLDAGGGLITLLNRSNQVVFEADYVGAFAATDPSDASGLTASSQSLMLSPKLQGVFLPYQRVASKEGGDTNRLFNPGYDAVGTPFTSSNAPPIAYADVAATDSQTVIPVIPVLVNDVEPDSIDELRVVAVGTNAPVSGSTNFSASGARVIINNAPTPGASIQYDPTASSILTALPQGSNRVDSFQYVIQDYLNGVANSRGTNSPDIALNLNKATARVTVTVTGVNAAPTPQDDSVSTRTNLTTSEDQVLDFTTATNVLWNDTDPNSDDNSSTLAIVSISSTNGYSTNTLTVTTALGATVTLDPRYNRNETHILYDPRGSAVLNALGQGSWTNDTFYYSVKDRYNAVGTASIRIRVSGVNDAPVAAPVTLATDEDTAFTNTASVMLAGATDPDTGDVLQISAVSPTSTLGAQVAVIGTNVIYDPRNSPTLNALANKEFTNDTFTCTVTDGRLTSNSIVTVRVAGVNDRPIPQADFYSTGEKTLFTTNAPGVLANDVEPDINGFVPDDSFRVIPATNASLWGVAVPMNADGSFRYDPRGYFDWLKQGQSTNDSFCYVVMDRSLSIAGDDQFAVTSGSISNLLPVLANDAVLSEAGGALRITGVTAPNQGGSVALNAASNGVVYTPLDGYVGVETFSYTVTDGLGGSDTAKVTVTLTASTLYASEDWFTVARGTTAVLDLLANDVLLPSTGASIRITALGAPSANGAVSLNGAGPGNAVNYIPDLSGVGDADETFSYMAASGSLVASSLVHVHIVDRTNALTGQNDYFTVLANSGAISLNVLANDGIVSVSNTNLLLTGVTTNDIIGTVWLNPAGTRLVYRPSPTATSENYSDLVGYSFRDNSGGTGTATVQIHVVAGGFYANDDRFVVVKDSLSNALPVMINDVLLPSYGEQLYISGLGIGSNAPSQGGAVAIDAAGTGLIYSPSSNNVTGSEILHYEISAGGISRALGTVTVTVKDFSTLVSNPDYYRVLPGSADNALTALKNDYPLPRTPGALTLTGLRTNGVHAAVAIVGANADNALLYTPAAGFIGTDWFRYEFTDALGNRGTNAVCVTVGSLAPQPDGMSVLNQSTSNLLDVLANDLIYPDTNSVRTVYAVGASDQGGSATPNPGGTAVIYTPATNFTGLEHFTYTLRDDSTNLFTATATVRVYARGSDRATNTVTMMVIGTNDPPTITGSANAAITDKQSIQPFTTVTLGDLDEDNQQVQTVTVTLDHLDNQTLTQLGGFTQNPVGTFTLQGTPAIVTAALRNLLLVPTPNHIPVPTTVPTHLLLSVSDAYVLAPVTNVTTVSITASNDAPGISGTVAGQTVYSHGSIKPFAGALLTEVDNDRTQAIRVTVILDSVAKGGLSSLGGFTNLGAGTYAIGSSNGSVTAAAATIALRGLVFTPTVASRVSPGTNEITRFTIRVDDFFAPTVADSNTTVAAIHPLTARITASDRSAGAQFGWSVAASRNLALVGAPQDSSGTKSGSAYLYARSQDGSNTWTQIKKLLPPDGISSDEFGTAVAMSGDTLVVGARLRDDKGTSSGAAYVFDRNQGGANQWGFIQKLLATDGAANDQFGTSVSIDQDTVAVGSPLANASSLANSGAVYLYARNQGGSNAWGQLKKLVASGPASGDHFGASVSLSGDSLVAGAPLVGSPNNTGAAYVFLRNQNGADQWGFSKKLVATNGTAAGQFGTAVAIAMDNVAVSAPVENASSLADAGAVYLYARNQGGSNLWGQVKKLVSPDLAAGDRFGSALALSADGLVVGAPFADANGIDSGAAYLFGQNQGGSNLWGQLDKFLPAAVGASDKFGAAVAVGQGTIAVGAYNGDSSLRSGTAFLFRTKFNNAPQVLVPLTNQSVTLNSPVTFSVPAGTFSDPDADDTLDLSLATSPAPPPWLAFDPVSGAFSGTATPAGTNQVAVVATDADGATATSPFYISVRSVGVVPFTLSMGMQTVGPNRIITLTLVGASGAYYQLQSTPALGGNAVWTNMGSVIQADGNGNITFSDPVSAGSMFYRAVVQ